MPHKRNHRLKDHKLLQQIAQSNPDTEDIFEDNLIDTLYPQRPATLEGVCLYDFVAHYDWQSRDGNRKYKKITKLRLPNHKLFDPLNETYRLLLHYYCCSLRSEMKVVFSSMNQLKKHFIVNEC